LDSLLKTIAKVLRDKEMHNSYQ